jgi:hypothetical protein
MAHEARSAVDLRQSRTAGSSELVRAPNASTPLTDCGTKLDRMVDVWSVRGGGS